MVPSPEVVEDLPCVMLSVVTDLFLETSWPRIENVKIINIQNEILKRWWLHLRSVQFYSGW